MVSRFKTAFLDRETGKVKSVKVRPRGNGQYEATNPFTKKVVLYRSGTSVD